MGLLKAAKNKREPDHEDALNLLGPEFDAEAFDPAAATNDLRATR